MLSLAAHFIQDPVWDCSFKSLLTYFSLWQRGGGLFLLQEAVADAAACTPTASDTDVLEAAGDEGTLVISRKALLGELRHVPSLVQELLQILRVLLQILTEARITSLSKSKLRGGRRRFGFLVSYFLKKLSNRFVLKRCQCSFHFLKQKVT